ncbi:MAG: carbohydrate kinase family protein [Firmicutes bacterium]|nr:carbohydrate kinase family protein [Bacillota bacterium]
MSIVAVGPIYVDIKGFPLDGYIPTGRNAGFIQYVYGGVSHNVIRDITSLNLKPTFVSMVDDSAIGQDILNALKERKVNTEYMQVCENGMGTWLAVFNENNDVAGSISARPDLTPLLTMLKEKGDEIISQADSVVVETDVDIEIVERMISLSKRHHKKIFGVVANMGIARERKELLKELDCFVCNEQEAEQLFYADYKDKSIEEIQANICKKINKWGYKAIVVTLGSKGCLYASQTGETGFVPSQKVSVVDTTGAGDAFFAGVTVGLTYNKSFEEACKLGTKLACNVIQSTESVCSYIERFDD